MHRDGKLEEYKSYNISKEEEAGWIEEIDCKIYGRAVHKELGCRYRSIDRC